MRRVLPLLLALLWAAGAAAAGPAPPATGAPPPCADVHITRINAPIAIDGRLDEPIWQTVAPETLFLQKEPNQGMPASQRTEVRLLYDDGALYVGARMFDTHPDSIGKMLMRRDAGGVRTDVFGICLDPYYDRRSGYYFRVTAGGTLYDGTLYNDGWSDDSWDGVWEARARVDDHGWTAEMKIPFSQVRFAGGDVQKWGINLYRGLARGFEDDYLVYTPRKESGFVSRFPTLVGLSNVNSGSAVELVPFATSKAAFLRHKPHDPFNDGSEIEPNLGGDLRMALGNKLTMNATVNPDFGQVEVDPAVVNLSDVETFFPEKRPFFVEGSSIFSAGQQGASDYWGFNYPQPTFFYSRRIGHAPQGDLPDHTAFADVPDGTTILGAAKVSGKLGEGLNVGMLNAVTSRERADLQMEDASRGRADVEPLTYYGVGRALKEFKERRNGLGVLGTVTARKFDESRLESDFNKASLSGVLDGWHFMDPGKVWVASGFLAGSYVNGTPARLQFLQGSSRRYYQRPDAKAYSFDSSATSLSGLGGRVWLNKEKGNWFSNSAIGFISPGFEINDLGFESRADVINSHAGLGYRWTNPTKNVKNHNALAAVFASRNFDGDLTNAGVWAKAFWWYTNNWTYQFQTAYNPETVNPRRSRGGPRMLNKPGLELSTFFDTDGSRKRYYYLDLYAYLQGGEDSFDWHIAPNFTYKPVSNVSIWLTPTYEVARDGAFYFTSYKDPTATNTYGSRYIFARLDQTTLSSDIRVNISFTPTMSLQFYGQPLVATGKYTNVRELARPKSLDFVGQGEGTGAWTYDPATQDFETHIATGASAPTNFNYASIRGNAVFRWEYLPGAALYFVWTQSRDGVDPTGTGDFNFGRSISQLGKFDKDNIFLVKATYYLTR